MIRGLKYVPTDQIAMWILVVDLFGPNEVGLPIEICKTLVVMPTDNQCRNSDCHTCPTNTEARP